ncbi:hypothetical protein Q9L58_000553 [Maublancomyces gigas]|uniref:Rieske domain-containing protein n=1 Tax=Discina gigas TaxID=1032678 RepID=A0ABR3GWD6_9PEZI
MNSSTRFPHSYHFSLVGITKLSNLNIPSTLGLSSSLILLAALVFIPLYVLILLHVRAGSSRKTPSVLCKEYASRRGVGQKGEIAVTVPAPIGGTHETELRVSKETNFPKDWWTSERLFQAEKRAIFSKSWLYATHSSRFQKPGDYLSFELASFPFFLILGKDRRLRAFHNVCRHRAYPVIREEKGSSTVVVCRYHGWTYNATGALIKAPQFEKVEGFDTSRNSLFEISLHVTDLGLVFVNFDASIDGPAVRFQDWYTGRVKEDVETLGLAKNGEYTWSQSWVIEGSFNWKAVIPVRKDCIWYSVRVVPLSVEKTALVYDVYCKPGSTTISREKIAALRERSRSAILEYEAQWINFRQFEERSIGGLKNMENEHQTHLLSLLQSHLKLEKAAGGEIYPAFAGARFMGAEGIEAELVCQELDRCNTAVGKFGGSDNALAW